MFKNSFVLSVSKMHDMYDKRNTNKFIDKNISTISFIIKLFTELQKHLI